MGNGLGERLWKEGRGKAIGQKERKGSCAWRARKRGPSFKKERGGRGRPRANKKNASKKAGQKDGKGANFRKSHVRQKKTVFSDLLRDVRGLKGRERRTSGPKFDLPSRGQKKAIFHAGIAKRGNPLEREKRAATMRTTQGGCKKRKKKLLLSGRGRNIEKVEPRCFRERDLASTPRKREGKSRVNLASSRRDVIFP